MTDLYRSSINDRSPVATAPDPSRHFDYLAIRVPNPFWSGMFVFGLSAAALAASAAGNRNGVIGYIGLTGLLMAFFPHFSLSANIRSAWLWLFPAWAALSIGWSINPDRTMHSTLLLVPTIIAALVVGAMPARREVNAGAALALFGYIAYSFVAGRSQMFADTGEGGVAMAGVVSGKNYFGHLAALSTIMSFALFGLRGRWALAFGAIGLVDLVMSGTALVLAHATGSLLAAGLAVAIGAFVLMFRHVGWQVRVLMVAALAGAIVIYVTFGQELQDQLFAAVLKTFNKDPGLTGRRYLWDFTDRLIGQRFVLGYGYNSFWFYTNPDAWTIWRMMGIPPMGGFNFHNEYRETLIDGGVVGLTLLVSTFGFSAVRAVSAGLKDGGLVAAVRLGYITYFMVRTGVESTGFAALTIDTTLLFGFVCLPLTVTPPTRAAMASGDAGQRSASQPVFRYS